MSHSRDAGYEGVVSSICAKSRRDGSFEAGLVRPTTAQRPWLVF